MSIECPPSEVIIKCYAYANSEYPIKFALGVQRDQVVSDGWKSAGYNYYEHPIPNGWKMVPYEFFYKKGLVGYDICVLESEAKVHQRESHPVKRKSWWARLLEAIAKAVQP